MSASTATAAISAELASTLADAFERAGFGPHSVSYEHGRGNYPKLWTLHAELSELCSGLPEFWSVPVSAELSRRSKERRLAALRAAYSALPNAAISGYYVERLEAEQLSEPKPADLRYLVKQAQRAISYRGLSHAPYKPEAGCSARLHLAEALHISHRQESYSDRSVYAVPVTVAPGTSEEELAICRRNLASFCAAARTASGFSGEGSTYSAELIQTESGFFVQLEARHSIPD